MVEPGEGGGYIVLSDEDYAKAVGQFRIAVGGVLNVFNMYGMSAFFLGAQEEIVHLAEDFGQRIRGIDQPISLDFVRSENGGRKTNGGRDDTD